MPAYVLNREGPACGENELGMEARHHGCREDGPFECQGKGRGGGQAIFPPLRRPKDQGQSLAGQELDRSTHRGSRSCYHISDIHHTIVITSQPPLSLPNQLTPDGGRVFQSPRTVPGPEPAPFAPFAPSPKPQALCAAFVSVPVPARFWPPKPALHRNQAVTSQTALNLISPLRCVVHKTPRPSRAGWKSGKKEIRNPGRKYSSAERDPLAAPHLIYRNTFSIRHILANSPASTAAI